MSLNKVMLIGNVGKKPEVRYIRENGSSFEKAVKVATFTLATNERYRDRNGEVRETTEWHDIAAWGGLADFVEKWVNKGSALYVEGRIRTKVWTDRDEKPHKLTEIIAGSIQLLDRRNSEATTASDTGKTTTASIPPQSSSAAEPSQPPKEAQTSQLSNTVQSSAASKARQAASKAPQTPSNPLMSPEYAPDDDLPF